MDLKYIVLHMPHWQENQHIQCMAAVEAFKNHLKDEKSVAYIFEIEDIDELKALMLGELGVLYKQNTLVLTDDGEMAFYCVDKKQDIACGVLLHETNQEEHFPTGVYCMQDLAQLEYTYLQKVYQRAKGLPWQILSTPRLMIREITVADVPRLYELYADSSITAYMEPLFESQEQEEEYTSQYIQNVYGFYGYGMWLITLKETGEVIGRAGLEYKEGFDGLELGFMLGAAYQHMGYAYEACEAILAYGKEELEQTAYRAVVHEDNLASQKLCDRLGFTKTGAWEENDMGKYLEYCIK